MNYIEENAELEREYEYLLLCYNTMYGPDTHFEREARSDRIDDLVYEDRVSRAYNEYARLYNSAKIITDEAARERWGYGPEYQTWENLDPTVKEPIVEANNKLLRLVIMGLREDVYGIRKVVD